MALRFEAEKAMQDYINYFHEELKFALEAWEQEVINNIMSDFIKKHGNPKVETYIREEENALIGFLEANPAVLADSFGTGSLMNVQDNPLFQEYRNSDKWNKARTSKKIVGRKEGYYTDIFGNKKYSSGYMEGEDLEYQEFRNGFQIEPILPSNAIKNANQWLYGTYLPNAFSNALKKINFSKYLIEVKK